MPEMHLRQPGFRYSDCGSFTKIKERVAKFKETGDSRYIYQNELDKAFFQHDMAYGDFKDLTRRKHLILIKIQNMMDIKGVWLQWFINFLVKKTSDSGIKRIFQTKSWLKNYTNQLLENLKKESKLAFYRQYLGC